MTEQKMGAEPPELRLQEAIILAERKIKRMELLIAAERGQHSKWVAVQMKAECAALQMLIDHARRSTSDVSL